MKESENEDFLYYDTRRNEFKILNNISNRIIDELKSGMINFDRIKTLSDIYKNIRG